MQHLFRRKQKRDPFDRIATLYFVTTFVYFLVLISTGGTVANLGALLLLPR